MEATGVSSSLTPEQTAAQAPDFGPQMPLSEKLLAIAIRAQNFTGASGVAVAIKEGDEVVCRASWGTSAPDVGVRLRDQNSFTYQCMRAGVAMRCDDASSDPRVNPVACASLGISSIAVAPVGHGDHVWGVIAAFSEEPNAFTETHMVVLTTLGEVVAKFLKDEPSLAAGASADEPVAPTIESAPASDAEPLHDVAPGPPSESASPALSDNLPAASAETAPPFQPAEVPTDVPAPPITPAEVHSQAPASAFAMPVLSSLLASARSKLPKGSVEKDPEIKPEEMRPPVDLPSTPGLVSAAEQISSAQKAPGFSAKSAGEKPSARAKPFTVPDRDKPALTAPSFGMAPAVEWNNVLHKKFVIPVAAAAVLVFALVTWTFHSFRSHHATPPTAPAIEQTAEPAPAQTTEPAELTSSIPASNTVMDVSAKASTNDKPAASAHKLNVDKPAEKAKAPVLETEAEVRTLNPIPIAPAKAEAAPPPSLALVEVPPQLPALKAAAAPSTVIGPSISHLVPSKLLHSPAPLYPDPAKRLHMTGIVVLEAKIGADGKVKSINVVSGPAVFRANAIAAVKSWRYRPATLDGQPVESTAEITLNFAEPR